MTDRIQSPRPASGHARESFTDAASMFWHAVDRAGARTALIDGERRIGYDQYGRAVCALAKRLEAIGARRERVAVLVPNSIEANVAIFAGLAAGAQIALLNPAYTPAELEPLLRIASPRVMIVLAGAEGSAIEAARTMRLPHLLTLGTGELALDQLIRTSVQRPAVPVAADELATLMFTGGTTGVPKGVDRCHRSLIEAIGGMDQAWPTRLDEEVWLNVAPVSHIWGSLMGCFNPVYGRSPLVIVPRFKPDPVVEAIERHRVTVFSGGPAAIYVGLLASARLEAADLSSLRLCPGGGSPFLLETLKAWEARTGVPILEAFGMTEAGPISANPSDGGHRFGTVGRPLPGIELQITDIDAPERPLPAGEVGEIRIRGSRVVSRYRGEGEGHPEGWLHTGDVGVLDETGFLRLVDRKKDMLIVSGFNVYPREIEEVLACHPDVAEAAVVGTPDPRKGEVPVAFVMARHGAASGAELERFCAERLAAYKRPRQVILLDLIPKTQANKVDRRRLAALAAEAGTTEERHGQD